MVTKVGGRALFVISILVWLLAGCQWQMFDSVEVAAQPELRVPGGKISVLMSEFGIFDELEDELRGDFDDFERVAEKPYTLRATQRPFSFETDEFFDDAGINEEVDIGDVEGEEVVVDLGLEEDVLDETMTIPEIAGTEELPPFSSTLASIEIDRLVEATIGEGSLVIRLGDTGVENQLPDGIYRISATLDVGADSISDDPEVVVEDGNPEYIELNFDLADLTIAHEDDIEITLGIEVEDTTVDEGVSKDVPLRSKEFEVSSFSTLTVDIGEGLLDGFEIEPQEIDEDLREDVKSIKLVTDDEASFIEIELNPTLPPGMTIDITLVNDELFDGGEDENESVTRTVDPAEGVQSLRFPVTNSDSIVFSDPDDPGEPGIDEFDIGIDIDVIDIDSDGSAYDSATGHLTLSDIDEGDTIAFSIVEIAAIIDLKAEEVVLRDINEFLEELENDDEEPMLGADDLEWLHDLPAWLKFSEVPLSFGILGNPEATPEDLKLVVDVEFEENGATVTRSLFDVDNEDFSFGEIFRTDDAGARALAEAFNARPDSIDFNFDFGTDEGEATELKLTAGEEFTVQLQFELVFAFFVDEGEDVDRVNISPDIFDGDEAYIPEDDFLGREEADELDDVFDNLREARLAVEMLRSDLGLEDGLRWELSDASGVFSSGGVSLGEQSIDLTQATVERMQETYPYLPEFRLFLDRREPGSGDDPYEMNYDGGLEARVTVTLKADVDYRFELFQEDE